MEEIGPGFGNAVTALCVSAFTVESIIQGNKNIKACYVDAKKTTSETMGSIASSFPEYTDILDKINNAGSIRCKVEQTPGLDSLISKLALKTHTYAIILVQSEEHSMDNTQWDKVISVIGYDGVVPNYTFIDSSEGCAFKFTDLDFEARDYLSSFNGASFTMIRIELVPPKPIEEETQKKIVATPTKKRPKKEEEEEQEQQEEQEVVKKKPKVIRKRVTKKAKEETQSIK